MSEQDYRSKFNSSAEVLHKLLEGKTVPVSDQYLRWKLWLNWKDIVGPTVSEHAEPISYHHGVLWLWVKNSVWMQHMTFMVEPIRQSVNQKFKEGFVKEVRLTTDRRQTPQLTNEEFKTNLKKFVR